MVGWIFERALHALTKSPQITPRGAKVFNGQYLEMGWFSGYGFQIFFYCLLIINRMVYMVLGNFEKTNWPYVRLKWDRLSKISQCLEIRNQPGKLYQSTEKSE